MGVLRRNFGGLSGDDMRVDGNIACGGGRHWPCLCRKGSGAVATGGFSAGGTGRWGGGSRMGSFSWTTQYLGRSSGGEDDARSKFFTVLLANAHFQATRERGAEEEPSEPRRKMAG